MTEQGDNQLDKMALVIFIQALSVTIGTIDDVPLDDRSGANFIRVFYEYLEELTKVAEVDGQQARPSVAILRNELQRCIDRLAQLD